MEDISLEDLAMGIAPKPKNGKKKEEVSDAVKKKVATMAKLIDNAESMSVKTMKKYNATELRFMLAAMDKVQDSMYRVKEMAREAMPKDSKKRMSGTCGMLHM